MKTLVVLMALLFCFASLGLAQQDPDDPGIQDSLIVGSYSVPEGGSFAFVQIFAVTDDSVAFYNLPLRWIAPEGGIYAGTGTQYFPPLTSWDERFDTVLINESYVRQIGFHDVGGENNPPLHTNGLRVNAWTLRFIVPPNTPSQLVVLDTTWDSHNASLILGLTDGVTEITPAFQRGFISIYPFGVGDDITTPKEFSLSQNYPNPFNPTTLIEFGLPQESHTQLVVYNLLGQTIKTIIDEVKAPGAYSVTWDGTDNSGNPQPSGTYFYRLTTSSDTETRRMTLIR